MSIIFVPKLTKKYLLFLKFLIFSSIRDVLKNNLHNLAGDNTLNYDKTIENKDLIEQRYFDVICNVFSDLLI